MQLLGSDIFIDSKKLDPNSTTDYCYAPFAEDKENPHDLTWVLGSVFLENYYVVFDMTPTMGKPDGVN
jgi:hypothetical protein